MATTEVVETKSGPVRGVAADGVTAFKGIPYGDDTSGAGRFKPARPPEAWSEVRDCTEYGPSCPQVLVAQMLGREMPPDVEESRAVWSYEREMGEECLVANVWTPGAGDGGQRPVLVWLHGGGLSTGSASWPLYDFTNLARKHDVVMVSINHRVGILGFLDVSHLGEEFSDSGNVGILDIVSALEWVRDNIAAFGGDPANVTIFGESGGGSKVTCLLGMPPARGLFRNAFAMSGALMRARTHEMAKQTTDVAVEHLGVAGDAGTLQKLEWAALVEAEAQIFRTARESAGRRPRAGFGPTLGPSLPQHPIDAVRAGNAAGVNVVIGCTTHEGLMALSPEVFFGDDDAVRDFAKVLLGDNADGLLAAYQAARPDDSMLSLLVLLASDQMMRIAHIRFAEALIEGGAPTRMYLFDFRQVLFPGLEPLASHGADMPYAFDNVDITPSAQAPDADAVTAAVSGALVAHGRNGDPNHDGLPAWPLYSVSERSTMVFDAESHVDGDPMSAERAAWDGIDVGAGLGG